mgnify:CR=1 FL=1
MSGPLEREKIDMVQSYNVWLPLPIANELEIEAERFHKVVESVLETLEINTLESRLASLQWISVESSRFAIYYQIFIFFKF